jgi:hypothetical protein
MIYELDLGRASDNVGVAVAKGSRLRKPLRHGLLTGIREADPARITMGLPPGNQEHP